MECIVLGNFDWYQFRGRANTSCVFIPDLNIVLDAGISIGKVYKYIQNDKRELHILSTHGHNDHVWGLWTIHEVLKDKVDKFNVYGPSSTMENIKNMFSKCASGYELPKGSEKFNLITLDDKLGSFDIDDIKIKYKRFPHIGIPVLGYRIEHDNKSLCYIVDTSIESSVKFGLLDFIKDADLVIHGCYDLIKPDNNKSHYTYASELGKTLKGKVKKLVVIGFSPHLENKEYSLDFVIRQYFDLGQFILIAKPGLRCKI